MDDPLLLFSPPVQRWFRATLGEPTPPQARGWPVIAAGEHALIVAPTGSGKTLAAFLWSLDRLFAELKAHPEPARGSSPDYLPGVRVVYVSPLKALNNDVERNLQVPLAGIQDVARAAGDLLPPIRVAVRTGDTPANEREKMRRRPPQVLITTPESLYLLLTSDRARSMFATTTTVIVDEVHTLVGTKRGAHLALSLERLERLAARPPQRIGLSATVRPLDSAARFLGGQDPRADHRPRPVHVVDAAYRKALDLQVMAPSTDEIAPTSGSVWPDLIRRVTRLIEEHRTTLIFCNNRRLAERTADRLNEERLRAVLGDAFPTTGPGDRGIFATGVDAALLRANGLEPIRAHHGSMSKAARLEMERDLKSGKLPALVCTSSLELGIDVGEVDLVVQLQSPKSVSSALQRIGRSGHRVGQTSIGRIFPTHADDLLEAAAVAWAVRRGEIEPLETPENPLDVLAQQLVAMVAVEDWDRRDALALIRGAYPFRNLGEASFRGVLEMLSGRYPESVSRYLRARLHWDRGADRLAALPGARGLAVGSGGTIPDRGSYLLVLGDRRTKVGELDEEFVFETRPGDTFLLGSQVWRTLEISADRVVAEPAPGEVPRMPFWRGDAPWRPYELGKRVGAFRRELTALVAALTPAEREELAEDTGQPELWGTGRTVHHRGTELPERGHRGFQSLGALSPVTLCLCGEPSVQFPNTGDASGSLGPAARAVLDFLVGESGLDREAAIQLVGYAARQLDLVGEIASDRVVVVETFADALGEPRLVVHSPFGGRVNGPWAIALAGAIRERLGVEAQVISGDDGFLLRFASADAPPPDDLVAAMTPAEARERLLAGLPDSATFGAQFRMNAARALLLPRERAGRRTPLWLARLRAKDLLQAVSTFPDFPIILETYRDCLRDVMDLSGLTEVLEGIQRGEIRVVRREAEAPSRTALGLDYRLAMQYVYEYDAPRGERRLAALSVDRALLADLLRDGTLAELLKPEAIAEVATRRGGTAEPIRGREELAQLLFERGDLSDDELAARSGDSASEWIAELEQSGRIARLRFGGAGRWVHAERLAEYRSLAERPAPVLRRFLAHAGPTSLTRLAERYGLDLATTQKALESLGDEVVAGRFGPDRAEEWIDRSMLEEMHRRTLTLLRREVRPVGLPIYAEFLRRWQDATDRHVADDAAAETTRSLHRALQTLRGLPLPGVSWERDVLPPRVPDFRATDLAELCAAGELHWVAEGGRDARRARVSFFYRGEGGIFLPRAPEEAVLGGLGTDARAVYDFLKAEGAALLADIIEGAGLERSEARSALVEVVLAGLATNDTLDALHAVLGHQPLPEARPLSPLEAQLAALRPDRPRPASRYRQRDARRHAREVVAAKEAERRQPWIGRWSLVHRPTLLGKPLAPEERALRQSRQLLARWGVVTRACLERESAEFSWDPIFAALSLLEARGEVRRGYFVEGLPGVQFALPDAVEQLRAVGAEISNDRASAEPRAADIAVLGATDPAQIFGSENAGGALRFPRVPSIAVASSRGEPVATLDENGSVQADPAHPALAPALAALARWWTPRLSGRVRVTRWNDEAATDSVGAPLLEAAGFIREYGAMAWKSQ